MTRYAVPPGAATSVFVVVLGLLPGGCGDDRPPAPAADEALSDPVGAQVEAANDPLAQAREGLEDPDLSRRVATALALTDRQDLPASDRAELLLSAMGREIAEPSPGPPGHGTYLTDTERLRHVYTRALGTLVATAPETLRTVAAEADGELRARAVLALGYGGQMEVVPELRDLLRTSAVGRVRTDAAFLLGELGAGDAVPDLREALADPYVVPVEGLDGTVRELHPVRDQAFGALLALGVEVEHLGAGEYRVVGGR